MGSVGYDMQPIPSARYDVEVAYDIVVVRRDPEYAEYDNPEGEILGERYYMRATNALGYAWVWGWHQTPEELELDYEFLAPPVEFWREGRPVYGSWAYQVEGIEQEDIAMEKKLDGVPF